VDVDAEAAEAKCEAFGYHLLFSTRTDLAAPNLLALSHGRDPVEKVWRIMKTDLEGATLGTRLDETTQGQIFINWGAAILHVLMENLIRDSGLDVSVRELLIAMRKVRITSMQGTTIAKTLPRKVRVMVNAMGIRTVFPEFKDYRGPEPVPEEAENGCRRGRKPKYPKA